MVVPGLTDGLPGQRKSQVLSGKVETLGARRKLVYDARCTRVGFSTVSLWVARTAL